MPLKKKKNLFILLLNPIKCRNVDEKGQLAFKKRKLFALKKKKKRSQEKETLFFFFSIYEKVKVVRKGRSRT